MSKKIMKRSLALGALMAFVITGSAMAGEKELKGVTTTVDTNMAEFQTNKIVGAYNHIGGKYDGSNTNDAFDFKTNIPTTNITIKSGTYDDVIGGSHFKTIANVDATNYDVHIGSTSVIINAGTIQDPDNATKKVLVAGGSKINNADRANVVIDKTVVIINDGYVNADVVGGNYIKTSRVGANPDYGAYNAINTTSVQNTTVEIHGGTIEGAVVAGSVTQRYNGLGDFGTAKITTTDEVTNLIITGGTIKGNVYGGAVAIGEGISATVEQVNMDISGIDGTTNRINGDIYTGGLVGQFLYNDQKQPVSTVETKNAIVNISNSTVNNIYAYNAYGEESFTGQPGPSGNFDSVVIKNQNAGNVPTDLTLTNVTAQTVDVKEGSVTLSRTDDGETTITNLIAGEKVAVSMEASGETTDALNGDAEAFAKKISVGGYDKEIKGVMRAGDVIGEIEFTKDSAGNVTAAPEKTNPYNDAIGEAAVALKSHWRAHMNDMNKRMGELRNANGEHGVWTRMVRGEAEYDGAKAQYNQYQLGYDEKLSVDKRWTVGAAVTFAEGDASYGYGSTEDDSTTFAIYGSKLNDDGTYVDLIARYARLESDLDDVKAGKGDYSTNGYSFSAEFGKRIEQGKGLWIEPQVELTYGSVDSAEFTFDNGKHVQVGDMDSFIGRVGFRIGKDVKQGNVYARASYLYDFDGETESTYSSATAADPRTIKEDLGGGWWEVGVGANINLSDATYIYADVEKTFGGEVDTNWQWNLGVRYSF